MNLHYLSYRARLGATNLHPFGRAGTDRLLAALDVRPGHRVLDVGCGTGETMLKLAAEFGVNVEGIDVLPDMLRVARFRLACAGVSARTRLHHTRPGDGLPVETAAYDRVYTESVLGFQNVPAATRMLSEIFRVLKPGGIYAANEAIWREGVTEEDARRITRAETMAFGLGRASEQAWSLDAWLTTMRGAGFHVVSASRLDDVAAGQESQSRRATARAARVSEFVTAAYRLKGWFHPSLRVQRAHYQRALRAHRSDREYIEARLFVLRKPTREP